MNEEQFYTRELRDAHNAAARRVGPAVLRYGAGEIAKLDAVFPRADGKNNQRSWERAFTTAEQRRPFIPTSVLGFQRRAFSGLTKVRALIGMALAEGIEYTPRPGYNIIRSEPERYDSLADAAEEAIAIWQNGRGDPWLSQAWVKIEIDYGGRFRTVQGERRAQRRGSEHVWLLTISYQAIITSPKAAKRKRAAALAKGQTPPKQLPKRKTGI